MKLRWSCSTRKGEPWMPSHQQRCFGAAYHEGSIPGGILLGSDNWSFSRAATHYIWLGVDQPTQLETAVEPPCQKPAHPHGNYFLVVARKGAEAELQCTVLWQCGGQLRLSCIEVNQNYNDCLKHLLTILWLHIILTWAAVWQFAQLTCSAISMLIFKTITTSTKIRRNL